MKKYCLIILLIIFSKSIFSQTDYYWYKNKRIYLEKNLHKRFIVFENISDSNELKQIINIPDLQIKSINKEKKFAIIYSKQQNLDILTLTKRSGIVYEAPFYFNNRNEDGGLSQYFYVKLIKAEDSLKLKELSLIHNVLIVGRNKFMPLWFTMKCDKKSKGNALDMSNLFYETGLFITAEPDFIVGKPGLCYTNDTYFNDQWALQNTGQNGWTSGIDINICPAWGITTGNEDIIVAIIDSGLDLDNNGLYHPDLRNKIYSISYDTETQTSPQQFSSYGLIHGSLVTGIVGAEANNNEGIAGVTQNCPLMIISNSMFSEPQYTEQMADGINFAWENGASVINNSWKSYDQSSLIDDAITAALIQGRDGLGCVVAFATGNDNGSVSYPANSNPAILAVGAISPCGERKSNWPVISCDGENNWGSNYGNELDVMAPGVKIISTSCNCTDGIYIYDMGGTSAACPHVAGIAALMLSINPNLSQKIICDIIEQTSRKVGGYNYQTTQGRLNGTWNNEMGYGLVDAYAAVNTANNTNCDIYLSNITYTTNTSITGCTITAENVTVDNNSSLILDALSYCLVNGVFEVKLGSQLEIK